MTPWIVIVVFSAFILVPVVYLSIHILTKEHVPDYSAMHTSVLGSACEVPPRKQPRLILRIQTAENTTFGLLFDSRYHWQEKDGLATDMLTYAHDIILHVGSTNESSCIIAPLSVYQHTRAHIPSSTDLDNLAIDLLTAPTTLSEVELCPRVNSQDPQGLTVQLLQGLYPPERDDSLDHNIDTADDRDELPTCSSETTDLFCGSLRRTDGESFPPNAAQPSEPSPVQDSIVDMSDMIIVLTACNHLNVTLTSLEYIKRAFANTADQHGHYPYIGKPPTVLTVDDHSSDNTTDILRAQGYFVVRTEQARGVTYGWNLGYK